MAKPTNVTPLVDLHPTLHNFHVDVKMYGAVGDGTTDDSSSVQAAVTAAGTGGVVYFPAGIYKIADSGSLTMLAGQTFRGAGPRSSYLTSKNAYALTTSSVDVLLIEHLGIAIRSGATTGGAIKIDSAGGLIIRDVEVNSQASNTDPAIWLKGTIGSHLQDVAVINGAAHGIRMDATGTTLAFNNENRLVHCRVNSVQGSTNAGIYSSGGGGNRFLGGDVESNRGYGIEIVGETHDSVEGIWFEDNSNHNLLIVDSLSCLVSGNKFHANHGDIGTADHVKITESRGVGQRNFHSIDRNHFQDAPSSGYGIELGANVEDTLIRRNRGIPNSMGVNDGGTRTKQELMDNSNASVTAAANITLVDGVTLFTVSGNTNISSITASPWDGRVVVLNFANAPTVVDGSNLILAGNFVATANDALTLISSGGFWIEIARSVN